MAYEECYAGWLLQPSPKMTERFDREITEMIVRDRNHPSVVMWGLLNETSEGPVLSHAVDTLPLVRSLDDSRVVMLNSGLFTFVGNAMDGLSLWNGEVGLEPNVTFNGKQGADPSGGRCLGSEPFGIAPRSERRVLRAALDGSCHRRVLRIGQVHRNCPTGKHRCSCAPPGSIAVRRIR